MQHSLSLPLLWQVPALFFSEPLFGPRTQLICQCANSSSNICLISIVERAWHSVSSGQGSVSDFIPNPKKETGFSGFISHRWWVSWRYKQLFCVALHLLCVLLIGSWFTLGDLRYRKQSRVGLNEEGNTYRLPTQLGVFAFALSRINVQQAIVWLRRRLLFECGTAPPPLHIATTSLYPLLCSWCLLHSWGWVGGPGDKTNIHCLNFFSGLVYSLQCDSF